MLPVYTSRKIPDSNDISIDETVGWVARNKHDGITKEQEDNETHRAISDCANQNILLAQWNKKKIYIATYSSSKNVL